MIRCIAVDDEAYAAEILATYIQRIPSLELTGVTTNAFEALAMVQEGKVDLVFLDIQMPELTGIQFLKICGSKCKVILTTAYPEYALDGFEHDVVDYLLKPISFERFYKAIQKVEQLLAPPALPANADQAGNASAQPNNQDYMFIKGESKNKFIKVAYNEILYIEGLKNYISVFTDKGRIVTYLTLREIEQYLPKNRFYRVHKSYIIPIDKVAMIDGNTIFIKEHTIPVGDTYREEFFKVIRDK